MKVLTLQSGDIKESFEIDQDVLTTSDVEFNKITGNGILTLECEEELFIDFDNAKAYGGLVSNIDNHDDNFDTITGQQVYSIGMNMDSNCDGVIDNYKDGNASFSAAHRFYQGSDRSFEGGYDIDTIVGGIIGACNNNNDINAVGKTLSAVNFGFYSDVYFSGSSTNGTHNVNNVLISGTLESRYHNVTNGVVRNIMLWAYNDLGLGIDNNPTFMPKVGDENYVILNESVYPIVMRADNSKMIFGAGDDAEIYYDGTNLVINPKAVGSGSLDLLGDLKINTGTNTKLISEELVFDLDALVTGLEVSIPIINATAYSNMPEVVNFPYLVGFYDRIAVLDNSEAGASEIFFSTIDFTNNASIVADFTNSRFLTNWDWCPQDDETYDLGGSGNQWKDLYLSGSIKVGGTSAVADGIYTVGIGSTQNGTITTKGGIITAIQEAI